MHRLMHHGYVCPSVQVSNRLSATGCVLASPFRAGDAKVHSFTFRHSLRRIASPSHFLCLLLSRCILLGDFRHHVAMVDAGEMRHELAQAQMTLSVATEVHCDGRK